MTDSNALGKFIADEVSRAESIFDSFRSRSTAVIAVSTGTVGVAAGLIAIAAGDSKEVLPPNGPKWVVIAVSLFVAATLLALLVHVPTTVSAADDSALVGFVSDHWEDDGWDKSVAEQQLVYLKSLHDANARFGRLMFGSLAAQLLAVASTGYLAVLIIRNVT